jgi:phosphoribosylformimino-5-aminoimidazole carboxamide ribonucleotide (ProFAR) isomerase
MLRLLQGGGIYAKADIEYYKDIGANHVSLGTVCFNPLKLRKLL